MSTLRSRETDGGDAASHLALVGCDFRVASSSWRSALVLAPEQRQELRDRLRSAASLRGLAVLDTCNRTEWIVESPHPAWAVQLLASWMLRIWRDCGFGPEMPQPYVHSGRQAVRHVLRVAVGLESFARGEREVAGQVHRALVLAREEGSSSPLLEELSRAAGRTVRRVERLAQFRDAAHGVHALATDLVIARLATLSPSLPVAPRIGVAGTGELGRKVAALLQARGAHVVTFNRTLRAGADCIALGDLSAHLCDLDAVIVATGALSPTVTLPVLPQRERPLMVLDLGIPAQVVLSASSPALELLTLDDLRASELSAPAPHDIAFAESSVELGVQELLLSCARRASASLLEAVQDAREEAAAQKLPAILDAHVPELDAPRRRRLEGALRELMQEQQRALVAQVEESARAGALPDRPTA